MRIHNRNNQLREKGNVISDKETKKIKTKNKNLSHICKLEFDEESNEDQNYFRVPSCFLPDDSQLAIH